MGLQFNEKKEFAWFTCAVVKRDNVLVKRDNVGVLWDVRRVSSP
jgi:hypothetical protein